MDHKEIRNRIIELTKDYYHAKFGNPVFKPGISRINYAGRAFDERELVNLVDSSLDFWLTEGRFAESFGVSDAILVNSITSIDLVALRAFKHPGI